MLFEYSGSDGDDLSEVALPFFCSVLLFLLKSASGLLARVGADVAGDLGEVGVLGVADDVGDWSGVLLLGAGRMLARMA